MSTNSKQRGWIERTRDAVDRRVNVLTLTDRGQKAFTAIATTGREHEKRITAGLTEGERTELLELLTKLARASRADPGRAPGLPPL